jgi:hypothetical protein
VKRFLPVILLCFVPLFFVLPQEGKDAEAGISDWDIDSLFDEPLSDPGDAGGSAAGGVREDGGAGETSLAGMIRKRGLTLDASYFFYGGVSPGWQEALWYWDNEDKEYSTFLGAGISSALGLDFQISEHLRIKNLFTFTVPDPVFTVKEVFVDYNLSDRIFFRGGKFTQNWGISPNYSYANLLSRLPPNNTGGDPYIVKVDVPIGIGGLELLALTRPGFITNTVLPTLDEIGFGGKYNLAYPWADLDIGVFYHKEMPLRNFVSIKSTVMNTEIYAEGMISVRHTPRELAGKWRSLVVEGAVYTQHTPWGGMVQGAGSVGFVREFFSGKLTINGEYFYNGEKDAWYFNPETNLEEAETSPFVYGHNMAMNVLYRTGFFKDLRLMAQCLYSINEQSAQFVPGLSFAPFPHINVSLGVPMALGSRDGAYYRHNADKNNRPFSIVLLVSISGDYRFTYAP